MRGGRQSAVQPRRWLIVVLTTLAFGPVLSTPAAASEPFSIISNGTVQLGIHEEGHLNVPGPASAQGTPVVGLRFVPTNNEGTGAGCPCEGWGAADATTGVTGFANESEEGAFNITPISLTATATTVQSVVEIGNVDLGGVLRVTHDYHPSAATPNLYEVTVTIENISGGTVDARYRRVMDWDVEPTAFAEFVTIETGNSTNLLYSSDNGFETANPLGSRSFLLFEGEAVDSGPDDHGALFDFGFGSVAAGGIVTFNIYYGAAATEADALAALAAVGAEVYSLGQPNTPDGPTLGTPNTFVFGFTGVGGDPVNLPPNAEDDSASTAENTPVNIDVLANDTDPDGDAVFVSDVSEPANGSASNIEGQTVTYTPNEGFTGVDMFTYTASDGELTDTATVTVTVTGANQPPDAMDDSASTAENTPVDIDVLVNDSDPDEDPFFISNVSEPGNGSAFNEGGTVTYTPNEGFTGTDTFTYTISDGELTDTATVTVNVGQADSCEVMVSEGCTATTDDGVTGPDNPISVTMTVPPGQPAGVYTVREIDQTDPIPKGAFIYTAPADATEIFIQVSCDESQCPRIRNRARDLQIIVTKENEDGTIKTLPLCAPRRPPIVNPPPCVFSVRRDVPGTGDLIWTVKVLGADPTVKGRG